MKTTAATPRAVIDACFVVALCAKEHNRFANAQTELQRYASNGWQFFAPGVLVAEAIYALCHKELDGSLTTAEHTTAIAALVTYLSAIDADPGGDKDLLLRAEQLRVGYGCSHCSDSLYLALAEKLAVNGPVEVITFDDGMRKQAAANAPSVVVRVVPSI